ncbi:4-hydroxybenzoate octaprenyltransferase [Adhaeretor mobilis]|uniref:4-hydroxybenzoate polyprenyltransferase n=1 Tax=Adhaeretor mobilis TaxID=1930276 RepID=A0A517N1K4_9BACT|nr:4-hydroxybenzoate octaprenyltransferase [Adhaeretor mobilis]QDT01014.1 4-hydroxybenzoate octaprenyltransferase [Adhaeretor mobilis]
MQQTARHFLSLIRFSHTIFALPFALLAAVMAWHAPTYEWTVTATVAQPVGPPPEVRWQELLGILLCMVTARSAAMAFNRLVDQKIDASNPRTAGRHLPSGILSASQVTVFAIACSLAFVASTLLFLPNTLPLYLSVPVLLFLCGYSLTKRFTSLAHFWLGAALAVSPLAAWIAIRGEIVLQNPTDLLPALVLGGAVLTWVAGFDILYACQDVDFDVQAKLHSVPVKLGVPGALRLAAGCHAMTVLLLAALSWAFPPFGWFYTAAVVAVAALLIYEHALVKPDDLDRVNTAFFNVNAVISLGLLAVGTLDLMLL